MTAQEKFEKARQRVLLDHRFFSTLMMRMDWIEDPSCNTLWTNGKAVGYNPTFIETLTIKQTIGCIIHEIMHPMMKHHLRIGNKDHESWNEACDLAINPLIIQYGFELPECTLLEQKFYGLSAEEIYKIIFQEKQNNKNNDGSNDDGSNDDSPNDDGSSDQDKGDDDNGKNNDSRNDDNGNDQDKGDDDSQNKSKKNDEKVGISKKFVTEIREATNDNGNPADEAESAKQEQEINIAITQAERLAEKAGQGFSDMKRMVEKIVKTETPWQEILSSFCYDNAKNEYDWSRPSRRHEYYMPSLHNYKPGNFVIVIDSSGSIDKTLLKIFMSEMATITSNVESEIVVIIADNKIQSAKAYMPDELENIEVTGGGGTDFQSAFRWVEENEISPTVMIYFTDLEGTFPKEAPNYPVLWASYGYWAKRINVPFGEKIIVK